MKIKNSDDFEEELDLYMYKETNGVKESKDVKMDKTEKPKEIKEEVKEIKEVKEEVKEEKKEVKEEEIVKKNVNIPKKRKKKNWIYTILIIIVLAGLVYYNWGNLFSNPTITSNVIVEVNGEKLTNEEFNEIYSKVTQQFPAADRDTVLSQTIDKMLLMQEAKKNNVEVNDDEVNEFIDNWLEQIRATFSEEELQEQLEMQGITLEELKEESEKSYRESLMINKLLEQTVLKENEVILPEMVKASHILVDSEEGANEILKELEEKEFSEVAKEKSTDPSAVSNMGELPFFDRQGNLITGGNLLQEFTDATWSLNIGEISQPVKTQYGYHIIKLEDKKSEETKLMSELTNEEKNSVLVELQQVVNEYVEELKNNANIKYSGEEEEEEIEIPEITGLVTEEVETEEVEEETEVEETGEIKTFKDTGDEICYEDNKPVIRLFSTTWCPHCTWIKNSFDKVMKEYDNIVAYHWELDKGDNTLTEEKEEAVPESEQEIYKKYNPTGGVPSYVFGCKYTRIGNGYESQDDLAAEEKEFRAVIEELLK